MAMLANKKIRDVLLESEFRGFAQQPRVFTLPVHLIMAPDVQQDDFLVGYDNSQCDSIAIGKTDGLDAFELATKVVIFQVWLEWVVLQVADDIGELFP